MDFVDGPQVVDFTRKIVAENLRVGQELTNLGLVDAIRRDGVFVIATVRGTIWSLFSGRGDVHLRDVVFHEAEIVTITEYED